MNLKLVAAISLFAAIPMVAFAQKDGDANKAPKPTVADVQKLVQMISADKAKLKAYCEIGKLQILAFLTDARLRQGDRFSLRAFHDLVWKNGNVPIALQRWELLGLDDEIRALDGGR